MKLSKVYFYTKISQAASMLIKPVNCILLMVTLLSSNFLYAENFYSSPAYPEYELLLNSDPEQLLIQLSKTDSEISLTNRTELILLRAKAYLAIGNYEESEKNQKIGFEFSIELKQPGIHGGFYLIEGNLLRTKGKMIEAGVAFDRALEQIVQTNDERLIAEAYMQRGYHQYVINNIEPALKDYILSFEIFEKNKDILNISRALSSIALVYEATSEYSKAIEYHTKSIALLDFESQIYEASIAVYNLASAYQNNKQLEEAETNYLKAIELASKVDNKLGLAFAEARLGVIAIEKKDFAKAESYLKGALQVMVDSNNLLAAYYIRTSLVDIYIQQKRGDDAKRTLAEIEVFETGKETSKYASKWSHLNARLSALEGDYESAYSFHKDYVEKTLAQLEAEKNNLVHRLEVKFDTKQKETENKVLKSQAQFQQLKMDKTETLNKFNLIVIATILLLVLFISYHLYKQTHFRKALEKLALTDELTGLPNRRHIMQLANEEIYRARRLNSTLFAGIIDFDFFKKVNDNYGHAVGDQMLRKFSELAQKEIREYDHIGRIGGEEWLVLFPHSSQSDLEAVIRRIREAVRSLTLTEANDRFKLTFSMGLTALKDEDKVAEELMKRADKALYKAKRNGRNCHYYEF